MIELTVTQSLWLLYAWRNALWGGQAGLQELELSPQLKQSTNRNDCNVSTRIGLRSKKTPSF